MTFFKASLVLILVSLSSTRSFAGWEVGGGDTYALKFVKTARLASDDIKRNANCALREKLRLADLITAVNTFEVVTANSDLPQTATQISVNRRVWPFETKLKKIEAVLKAYTRTSAHPFVGPLTATDVGTCFTSLDWNKIYDHGPGEDTRSALEIESDVAKSARLLLQRLSDQPEAGFLPKVEVCAIQNAVIHTEAFQIAKSTSQQAANCPKHAVISTEFGSSPIALSFRDQATKDGLNFRSPASNGLFINRSIWRTLSQGQKMELLLHEYLGIIKVDDHRYQISSRLFYDLPAQDYFD